MRLGYGEMLVGMSTFVEAYFEDQRENMEEEDGDDNFEVDKFAKCEEYDPDEDADDANQGAWENYQFFVGPTCTEYDDDGDAEIRELCMESYEMAAYKCEEGMEY